VSRATFAAIHRHGFVRTAAASPTGSSGDVTFNVEQAIELSREADRRGCDLVVFPELNISSYAVDDLFMQEAFLDAVEMGIARFCGETEGLAPAFVIGAPLRRNGRLYNCALVISRGRILGVVPKSFLPNYREYYEKRWFVSASASEGLEIGRRPADGAVRHRPRLRRRGPRRLHLPRRRSARITGRRSRPRRSAPSPGR
jgi:NAD+ synthase (glutamine-hydrolysing)